MVCKLLNLHATLDKTEKTIPMGNTLAKIIFALNLSDIEIRELLIYYSNKTIKKGKKEIF